jgi:hypothetical protein
LPMDETMPIPVTTTRLIFASSQFGSVFLLPVEHDPSAKPVAASGSYAYSVRHDLAQCDMILSENRLVLFRIMLRRRWPAALARESMPP